MQTPQRKEIPILGTLWLAGISFGNLHRNSKEFAA